MNQKELIEMLRNGSEFSNFDHGWNSAIIKVLKDLNTPSKESKNKKLTKEAKENIFGKNYNPSFNYKTNRHE